MKKEENALLSAVGIDPNEFWAWKEDMGINDDGY
jgi:hypothetical protein